MAQNSMPSWCVKARSWDVARPDSDDCDFLFFLLSHGLSCLNPFFYCLKYPFFLRNGYGPQVTEQNYTIPAYMRNETNKTNGQSEESGVLWKKKKRLFCRRGGYTRGDEIEADRASVLRKQYGGVFWIFFFFLFPVLFASTRAISWLSISLSLTTFFFAFFVSVLFGLVK